MYLSFYCLKTKPFRITCDPRFLWLGENHKEALAVLRYGILDNRGFLVLTGEVGTGKTLLINRLLTMLPPGTAVATLPDPDLSRTDFYRLLADGLKLPAPSNSKADFLIQLRDFLHLNAGRKKQVLLIIDEAQRLNQDLMEDIRVLSNIEFSDRKLINIFFVGQPEFNHLIMNQQNRALTQRITIRHQIQPLSQEEIDRYICHRLKVAGGTHKIFKGSAVKKIFAYSGGIPRLINIVCDHALVTGYIQHKKKIGAEIITECADELGVSGWRSPWSHSFLRKGVFKIPSEAIQMPLHSVDGSVDAVGGPKSRPETHPAPPSSRIWSYAAMVASIVVVWLLVITQLPGPTGTDLQKWPLMRSQHAWDVSTASALMVAHPDLIPLDDIRSIFETAPPSAEPEMPVIERAENETGRLSDSAAGEKSPPPSQRVSELDATAAVMEAVRAAPKTISSQPDTAPVLKKFEVDGHEMLPPGQGASSQETETDPETPLVVSAGPSKNSVEIQFDGSDQIAFHSMPEMDRVAAYLVAYPERVIYIWSPPAEEAMSADHLSRWRQRVALVKDYLLSKGAYTYQVKASAKEVGRRNLSAGRRPLSGAMIEFPQAHAPVGYNPDK